VDDPFLVEVTRGGLVESRHRGAVAVCDCEGRAVFGLGDIGTPVFPRSAIKAFQALPLVESGAADRYGLTQAEIALACASHSGEPIHARTALAMLQKCGRNAETLECGVHWPSNNEAARALAAGGAKPSALHNNCSGKHAGFVCLSCASEVEPGGYVAPDHLVQREVRAAIEDMTRTTLDDPSLRAVDGCSIPTYAIPLKAIAQGFARFGAGDRLSPARAAAAKRIREAVAAHPDMVAGTGRFDTVVMKALGLRAFVKTGGRRLLRRLSRTGPWRRDQVRGRRGTRRRDRDGGDHLPLSTLGLAGTRRARRPFRATAPQLERRASRRDPAGRNVDGTAAELNRSESFELGRASG
jgi:L-asparaginase II